jgi:hypothetical protein
MTTLQKAYKPAIQVDEQTRIKEKEEPHKTFIGDKHEVDKY